MKEIIILFLLVVAQNASFTLVSRARNSKSLLYHFLASIGSNGIWLLVFANMVANVDDAASKWTYLVASVLGSIGMHYAAMKWFEKPKQALVQRPTVGRIVLYKGFGDNYLPGIITKVHSEGIVDIHTFGNSTHVKNVVVQGSQNYTWSWPKLK